MAKAQIEGCVCGSGALVRVRVGGGCRFYRGKEHRENDGCSVMVALICAAESSNRPSGSGPDAENGNGQADPSPKDTQVIGYREVA